ncbi:helix-turn-helix domain-containing protein [Streptococcus pseudoporcinus]|uniref:Transcriptional regulator, AraC family n=1 Tax=Streptococcus pseudoporcinus LQ 940-04 TaxID=875093 RepID=G5KBP1_9STRE|nr:AraC family transcriptional regulator [Streptococcus pseudoporcinus]EFR45375.1 transcriptional regulator, AraC family [Streptococcus pseudoporcinus SPIN 20026]EHI65651.1 transcriptional regulator, AraC family [Streptococcus pseudoporcinus LQ 940-04]VEF92895.1 AraC family transcriptional regulator [Streptococcus pseudoporcinus]
MLTTDQQTTNEPQHHLLPYRYFHQEVKHGRPDILFHWHPEMEITYVSEGCARYHIDYDFFNSQSGDIILVRPHGMHSIHPIAQHPHVTDTFQFHLDMIGSSIVDQVSLHYLQPLQNSSYKFVHCIKPHMAGYDQIKTCLLSIFAISREEDRHFELLLKSRLHEFLYLLYYYHYVTRKHTDDTYRKNEKIRQLIDYINTHYQKPLTIDFLANAMGYSKTHFMTVFKQHTGTPCTEFIIQVRLSKACELLINSIQPILEIANEVGFNSLSNFNRQFKAYYLLTPSQYRKKYTKPKVGRTMINPPKLQKKPPF